MTEPDGGGAGSGGGAPEVRRSRSAPSRSLPVVGVMGSGTEAHDDLAAPLGRWLARRGVHLLTGGGRGVMAAVSRAFHAVADRRGLVIGILPAEAERVTSGGAAPPPGYPNPWIELPIRTHLSARGDQGTAAESRNHVNVLSSDVVVALPGGPGTASEIELAVRYGRPVVVFDRKGHRPSTDAAGVRVVTTLDGIAAFIDDALGS